MSTLDNLMNNLQQTHTSLYTSKLWLIVSVGCWLIHEDFRRSVVCHQYCSIVTNLHIDCISSCSNGLDQCSTDCKPPL